MTSEPKNSRHLPTGAKRLVAGLGVLALAGVAVTSASFNDQAILNLGSGAEGSGIGNPVLFDIAVLDADNNLQDAATPGDAVVLPLTSGTSFSEDSPVTFEIRFENREPGIEGDLTLSVYDPDDSGAEDLYSSLLFTMYLQGSATATVTNASAADLNAAVIVASNLAPGESLDVKLNVQIAPGVGLAAAGKATQLGIRAAGESR